MEKQVGKRVRRSVEASRLAILESAEGRLIAEGPHGVKVQLIARDLGISDAAIHYHFGNREGLLDALLRFSGRRFVDELSQLMTSSADTGIDLATAAGMLSDLYGRQGTARLFMWLTLSGWSTEGAGMFQPLVDGLHVSRLKQARDAGAPEPLLADSQKLIALVSAVAFAQALSGDAWLRSVGLEPQPQGGLPSWVTTMLAGGA